MSEDLSCMRYELERFLLGGAFELCEDSKRIATVEPGCATAELSYGKLILSCWGDGWSRSWRVLRFESSAQYFHIECAKQMGRVTCTLDLRRGDIEPSANASREALPAKLAAMIESRFSNLRVARAVLRRDDKQNFTGIHARLLLKEQGRVIAAVGVSLNESPRDVAATLGAGIVWLNALRERGAQVNRLMIFVPRGQSETIAARLTAVNLRAASVSLYEVDDAQSLIEAVTPFDQGDLSDRLRHAAKRAEWPHEQRLPLDAMMLIGSIRRLAPDLISVQRRGAYALLAIHGLEFARVSLRRNRVEFGVGPSKEPLTPTNQSRLEALVAEIAAARRADSADPHALLFREQSERWLESILQRDITAIDASLDRRYAYSQVPAYRGEQRAFIDLLAATRDGQLVVIELKVSEDIEFPFQAVDYWLRIDWHRRRGDFERRGYFKQLRLADRPPLIYLVAPVFRFHATTRLIASTIARHLAVTRIGINDDWRSGVRVLLAERMNGEK
ncbi:MAG: hypothetical protein ACJ74J_15070 [Blastocatellia bacterium]